MNGSRWRDGRTPTGDRREHPYADEFGNERAWQFEDGLRAIARAARDADDFELRLAILWERLCGRNQSLADGWMSFLARKLADELRPDEVALAQDHIGERTRQSPGTSELRSIDDAGPALPEDTLPQGWVERLRERAGGHADPEPEAPELRPVDDSGAFGPNASLPEGWTAELIGVWAGHESVLVYDARRYAVLSTHNGKADLMDQLSADGWETLAQDGTRVLWIKDRFAATRAALTRFDEAAAGAKSPDIRSGVAGVDDPPAPGGEVTL